jgi:nucleolysin TIA-1/TIAR
MDSSGNTTLYVGNLDHSVTEELICALFSQMGPVKSCKVIRDSGSDPYAFVEYQHHSAAATALGAMNKRLFFDREMKVNWATSSAGNQPKTDTSQHHHIFVGDLSPEIETETLREAFSPFGEISNCRIVRDPQTLKSKGYAFVSFVRKSDAESAINAMNGQWLGSRAIRTNWSTRKPPAPTGKGSKTADYEEIFNKTGPTNTTVYCGGFSANVLTDDIIYKHFGQFGPIHDIRVFKDKGYAFIKFSTKESAARAIEGTNNTDVYGHTVKCFWGKENINGADPSQATAMMQGQSIIAAAAPPQANPTQQQLQQQQFYYQQMGGYWYPAAAAAASYPQMTAQAAQYMQQGYAAAAGYPFAYAAASPQNPAAAGYTRLIPQTGLPANMAWGVPPPNAAAAAAAIPNQISNSISNGGSSTNNSNNGTPQPMQLYTMPQFQTQ